MLRNQSVRVGEIIEGWEYDEEQDKKNKYILKVLSVSEAGVFAMDTSPFSKPHKDAKFFRNGSFKIYEP
tara:strand:- start:2392 stop:2598 length:207 start_codon:yes stop_codon:yes gene_type:complete